MRFAGLHFLLLGAALALGCSPASSQGVGSGGRSDAGYIGGQGSGGNGAGGGSGATRDAAASDAGAHRDGAVESNQSNLSADAPSFNWDTYACSGCSSTGGATGGGTTAGGAGGATGGLGGRGAGGSTAGGTGNGGSSGGGGRTSTADASVGDAPVGPGGSPGTGGSLSGSGGRAGAGGALSVDGAASLADSAADGRPFSNDVLGAADASTPRADAGSALPDSGMPDTLPACTAQIVPVVPARERIDHLVASASAKVVLHAQVTSGVLPPGASWSWQGTWEGLFLPAAAVGTKDPAAASFAIASPGKYTFTATAGACQATVASFAVAPSACGTTCDKTVIVHAVPLANSVVPVQSGALLLQGSAPFQTNLLLAPGVLVQVAPSVGSTVVNSYVRINDKLGGLVVDGLADARAGGFTSRLRLLDEARSLLTYDVLVVPINGPDGSTIQATAPQLYQMLDPGSINGAFPLSGGVTVTGTTVSVSGQPLADVRVMLSNQNPGLVEQRRDLIFSSVGRSDALGNYTLHVQKGTYWVSFSPPPDSGLSEALGASTLDIGGDAALAFKWDAPSTAGLTLRVLDASGAPRSQVSVRATLTQSRAVGALTLTPAAGVASTQLANGNVQVEATSDAAGMVVFPKLPANETYDVLLSPETPDAFSATTTMTVALAAGGTVATAQLWAQSTILGQLAPQASVPLDYSRVTIVAYDRSLDAPEAPRSMLANSDGRFAFGVTPGRPYVLLAVPEIGSGYARTFVGPGLLQASEFVIAQTLLLSMPWQATVMDEDQNGLADTALQIFCGASWPTCVDPGVPLAETTSDVDGAFQLELPDPSSRL